MVDENRILLKFNSEKDAKVFKELFESERTGPNGKIKIEIDGDMIILIYDSAIMALNNAIVFMEFIEGSYYQCNVDAQNQNRRCQNCNQ